MKIKNKALIESLKTDTITEDMNISMLELALDQEYDFDEIRAIQKMFNISIINIGKSLTKYDEDGNTIEVEEANLSDEQKAENDEKCLRFINELDPDNIVRLQFHYDKKEFDTSILDKFKDLNVIDAIGYNGMESFRLEIGNNALIKFTGKNDILSYFAKLDSNKPKIDLENLQDVEKARISPNQDIVEVLPKVSNISTLKEILPSKQTITLDEIKALRNANIGIGDKSHLTVSIKDVSELSPEQFKQLSSNLPIEKVQLYSKTNNTHQNQPYDFDLYSAIYGELEKIVEGIDDNLPEKEKFAEIYKRITTSIAYDTPAAYPKTPEEEQYRKDEVVNCRNLKNGLLYKKCVCAGYADILRNALALKGIEAQYISGPIDKKIDISLLNDPMFKDATILSRDEANGKVVVREYHAWNKVKLDGKWYNTDPTWDRNTLLYGEPPKFALKSDEEFKKQGRTEFYGPECSESMDQNEVKDMFCGKHIRIGKFELPNFRDFKKYIKDGIDEIKSIPNDIKEGIDAIKNIPTDIKKIYTTVSNRIKNILNSPKALNSGSETHTDKKTEEEHHPWDLENWGTDRNQFNEQRNNAINEFIKNTEERKDSEQDKNTEIDGRE